jgi:hypothetical protein
MILPNKMSASFYQAKLEKILALLPEARSEFELLREQFNTVQEMGETDESLFKALIDARLPLQLATMMQWIIMVDDPMYAKVNINDEYVEETFGRYLNTMQYLKTARYNPGAEFIDSNFGKLITNLLQQNAHPKFKARVVWFALTLSDMYCGEKSIRYSPPHLEDEKVLLEEAKYFAAVKRPHFC